MFDILNTNRRLNDGAERRKRIFDNLEILCSPEFDEIFTKLFGEFEGRMEKPRVYSIRVPEQTKEDAVQAKKMMDDFHWKIDDTKEDDGEDDEGLDEGDAYEDDESPYIHEQDVVYSEDEEDEEDDEIEKVPPSIFDVLASGKKFSDIVSPNLKRTDSHNSEDDEVPEAKNPFVFIANRLTFLIQTMFPIVFDTSMIDTEENSITIGVNQEKTYPKLGTIDDIGFITSEINRANAIQQEIGEYLGDTEFINIYCFPSTIIDERHDKIQMAVKFVIYKKRKHINF